MLSREELTTALKNYRPGKGPGALGMLMLDVADNSGLDTATVESAQMTALVCTLLQALVAPQEAGPAVSRLCESLAGSMIQDLEQ